jgi:rhodanese-related sulfurtransferase
VARRRQLETLRQAPEQPHPEMGFEVGDPVADGPLGEVHLVRRTSEVEVPCGRFERAERTDRRQASGHCGHTFRHAFRTKDALPAAPLPDRLCTRTTLEAAMSGTRSGLAVEALAGQVGTAMSPTIVDVRRRAALEESGRMIVGAAWREMDDRAGWYRELESTRPILVYCGHGHERSQGVVAELRAAGHGAHYLEGGFDAWMAAGAPSIARHAIAERAGPSVWVTRERPKIDRIACPWLIRRFIDPRAVIHYVAPDMVLEMASAFGFEPFDVPEVRLSHRGEWCSFDTFIHEFQIEDRQLDYLALIVRGADTARPELAPEAPGLLALSFGLSALYQDDQTMLERGMLLYEALYAWRRDAAHERHTWVGAPARG